MDLQNRKPKEKEIRLIDFLMKKGSLIYKVDWEKYLLVTPMDDGGMGSLILTEENSLNRQRFYGRTVSELEYKDADNVTVIISLNIDDKGKLYELDFWKVDFSPLIEFPKI